MDKMSTPKPRSLSVTVSPRQEGMTVKSLLRREFHMSDSYIARLKLRPEGIRRNGERVFTTARVSAGDVLTVRVEDAAGKNAAAPISAPLSFVYEDEDLAVLNKRAGMAVHGSERGAEPTIANALAFLWGAQQPFHPAHRLDRGTSGLMVIAKSAYAHELLRRELHTPDFDREYVALVRGEIENTQGVVDLPIGREEGHPTRRRVCADGQSARTEYEVLDVFPGGSLVRLRPLTGRTHQLRVHMAALGHPLFGDRLYDPAGEDCLAYPALHAGRIELCQPITGQRLTLTAPMRQEMQASWDEKRGKTIQK